MGSCFVSEESFVETNTILEMGANQSTRKLTVVSDEATGVVKISDSVLERLKGEISGEKKDPSPPTPPPPSPQAEPQKEPEAATPPPAAPVQPPAEETPASAPAPPAAPVAPVAPPEHVQSQVWQRPIIQYIEEPSISALRVRAEKEEEMKTLEGYWKDRIQKQEDTYLANSKLSEEEILKKAQYVQSLFKPAATGDFCGQSQSAVQSCYESNPGRTLHCRDQVLQFTSCVAGAQR